MTLKTGYLGWNEFDQKIEGMRKTHLWCNGGVVLFDIKQRVEVYAFLGAARMSIEQSASPYHKNCSRDNLLSTCKSMHTTRLKYLTDTTPGGQVGIHALIYDTRRLALGVQASYFQMHGKVKSMQKDTLECRKWQVGCATAWDLLAISPYLGVRYTKTQLHFSKKKHTNYSSEMPLGVFFGGSFSTPKVLALSFEIGLINEYSFALMLTARI